MSLFYIFGSSYDSDTYFSKHIALRIAKINPENKIQFEIMNEIDYQIKLNDFKNKLGGGFHNHKYNHCVMRDGKFLGDLMAIARLATDEFGIEDSEIANTLIFEKNAKEDTLNILKQSEMKCAYLDFYGPPVDNEDERVKYGRLVIEL